MLAVFTTVLPFAQTAMKSPRFDHRSYVELRAPAFAQAVQAAKAASAVQPNQTVEIQGAPVSVSLASFPAEDMALVYAALLYAQGEGVPVLFKP